MTVAPDLVDLHSPAPAALASAAPSPATVDSAPVETAASAPALSKSLYHSNSWLTTGGQLKHAEMLGHLETLSEAVTVTSNFREMLLGGYPPSIYILYFHKLNNICPKTEIEYYTQ